MTVSVIDQIEDYDDYVTAKARRTRRNGVLIIVAVLVLGIAYYAVLGARMTALYDEAVKPQIPLVEAIDWNHQGRIPTPGTGQETPAQLQDSIDRMFYEERNGTEVVTIPRDQEVFMLGKAPKGRYDGYYPSALYPDWLPSQVCTIEKHGLLSEIASDDRRVLFTYAPPSSEFYDPDVPNRCSDNVLLFEQLR
jgi:hypothetical protein